MAGKTKADSFANVAAISVTEASAGTAAYSKFAFPFSIMDKMALIISRIEYLQGNINQLNTSADYMITALTVSNAVSDLGNQADPLIVDSCRLQRIDIGTAASGLLLNQPYVKDFSSLPGGGLLVAPSPLYAAIISNGAGGVTSLWMRLYYTYVELNSDEYWQLVESRRIISS